MKPRNLKRLLAAALAGPIIIASSAVAANAETTPEPTPFDDVADIEPTYDIDNAITEFVYVQSDMDSDGDGRPDRIGVAIMRPAETDHGAKVPVIAQPSPYYNLSSSSMSAQSDFHIPLADGFEPRHFSSWYGNYFVPRGYAYIEPEMQGTASSEGCPTTGGVEDTQSVTAVVDWLAGRTTATYADGTEAVADWAEPAVGMIGGSYNGTLPNAVAATGIEEVKAIVPVVAISSWYDYTRAEGVGLRGWDRAYVRYLADFVANPRARSLCQDVWNQMVADADDATHDYNRFWDERNYRTDADQVQAAVLHVHGQNDHNVKTTHTGRWWEALAQHDVDQKLYLHPGAHSEPPNTGPYRQLVHNWFDHFLKGIDNGVLDGPDVIVDRASGTDHYDHWPNPAGSDVTYYLGEDARGVGTLSTNPSSWGTHRVTANPPNESTMLSNPTQLRNDRRVFLSEPMRGAQQLSGIVDIDVTFSSATSSAALGAVLVSYDPAGNATFITRNGADGKNYQSLWNQQALTPGATYEMNFELQPRDVIIPDGHRIGVVLVMNHPTLTTFDSNSRTVDFHLGASALNLHLTPA
ncbi:CocE/NonD family hydrolase [Natronoglycomyces albus]|uniref:Xaa-Pro dipeptidyl-peptidase C-terminal domain-containing protein n=1 Tax=Natronoglycomyces albus TaxID=2811108 RepID=A0A895XM72_9ACTN|nr:CocE/NonD family hydrolase [Natronoglycomyces albus]QSB04872.1 hypothetical protein JQS30_14055 [Natronoglycomyces albus]